MWWHSKEAGLCSRGCVSEPTGGGVWVEQHVCDLVVWEVGYHGAGEVAEALSCPVPDCGGGEGGGRAREAVQTLLDVAPREGWHGGLWRCG